MSGGPLDLSKIKSDNNVDGIIWAGYPGQSGGQAIAQVIFGDVSPAGRLPHTIYPAEYINQISMEGNQLICSYHFSLHGISLFTPSLPLFIHRLDMGMRPNSTTKSPGRTYRFYTGRHGIYL